MARFFKIACALLMVFSFIAVAAPGSVQAADHVDSTVATTVEHSEHYHVYYGTCPHSMRLYGSFDCPFEVEQVARQLRLNGYVVRVSSH